MSYRDELIQVAAVAIAMIQDLEQGTTQIEIEDTDVMDSVIADVAHERFRQENKWGPQHHSKERWFAILGEEVGEVANTILENE